MLLAAALMGFLALDLVPATSPTGTLASYSSDPQGSDAYLAFPNTTAGNDGTVEALDSMNGQVLGSGLTVGVNPGSIAVDTPASELVVPNSGDGVHSATTASIIDTAPSSWSVTSTVTGLPTGSKPAAAMDVPKSLALVVDNAADDVSVISTSGTPSLVGNLSLGVSGGEPSSIAVSPDGVWVYVTIPNESDVIILEYNGISADDDFSVWETYNHTSFTPEAITESPDGDLAYVSNTSTDVIDKFDDSPFKWSLSSSTISVSAAPGSIVAAPEGMVYAALPSLDKVAFIDTTEATSAVVTNYSRSSSPGPIALNSDGSVLAVASSSTTAAEFVNTATGGTANTASSLPNTPSAVATASTIQPRFFAYVANYGAGTVSVIDTITNTVVQTLSVGSGPCSVVVAPDNSAVYVANISSSTVSVIDPADIMTSTNPVVGTVSDLTASSDPDALALSPSGTSLLVAEASVGQLQVVDTNPSDGDYLDVVTSSSPIDLNGSGVDAGALPASIAFAASGQDAYVADGGLGAVTVIDPSAVAGGYSFDAEQTSLGLTTPFGIAIAPNASAAYVTDNSTGKLWSFPVVSSTGELTTTGDADVSVGSEPRSVTLSPEGQTAYVANSGSASVSLVSTSTMSLASTDAISESAPYDVAVTPDGSSYFVANGTGTSSSEAYATGESAESISVETNPVSVAIGNWFTSPGTVSTPAASETTGGASNLSEAWQSGDVQPIGSSKAFSESVDPATGAYDLAITDFDIPDIGPTLDMTQTYDSGNASTSGPLGYGWSFSYGMSLSGPTYSSLTGTCTITITQGDGSTVSFTAASSGTCPTSGYDSPVWVDANLGHAASCHAGDACWLLEEPDGTDYKFDATTGDLVYIVDKDANTATLAYSSGELSSVTAESGVRDLSFTWSGGYVSTVTDNLGREAALSYSSGDLTKITMTASNDPTTHYFQFSYNSSPATLKDWWSPTNDPTGSSPSSDVETEIIYDGSNRADEILEPQRSFEGSEVEINPEWSFSWPSFNQSDGTGGVLISDPNENDGQTDGNVTLDTFVDRTLVSQVQGYGVSGEATTMNLSVRNPESLLPVETTDGDGYLTTTLYDANGDPLVSSDPLGRVTSEEYNGFSEVVASIDAMGNETTNGYNSDGDLTSSTDPLGNETSWAYGSGAPAGSAHTTTNALTGVTTYGYDAEGDLTSTEDPDGDITSSLYDAVGELCASLSANGYAASDRIPGSCPGSAASFLTVYPKYDFFGQNLEKITPTNAAGGTWSYTYDPDGNETSVENPDSQTTSYTYDADDEQISAAQPAATYSGSSVSPTTTYDYDPDGNKVSTTTQLGYATVLGYDNLGQETSSTDPLGNLTTYFYDGDGNQVAYTLPKGNPGGVPSSCDPLTTSGCSYTYYSTYDADGEVLTQTDPAGDESTSGYNADGEQDCAGTPNATEAGYTCPADPTGPVTDTTTTTYTADHKTAVVEDPLGNVTTHYYDADNNELAYTEPQGDPGTCDPLTTSHCAYTYYYVYDDANRMTSMTTPPTAGSASGETTSYTYDADGNQKSVTDPLGQVTTNSYDGLDELTGITYTDTVNSTPNVTYSYTNEGKPYQMSDGTGTTTYTYNADAITTEIQNGAGAVLTYTYNADLDLTCIAYPGAGNTCSSAPGSGNEVVDYTYDDDDDDRLSTITDWDGDTLTYTYTHDSVPQELSANSGAVTENITYNSADETTDLDTTASSTTLLNLAYTYDYDGNPIKETPTIGSSVHTIENFEVDAADRVNIFWTGSDGAPTANVNYGDDGELIQNGTVASDQSAGYDEAGELCWTYSSASSNACSSPPSGSTAYTEDADGERTTEVPSSGNSQAYDWNAANELVCANTNGSTCSIGSPTASTTLYAYDGNGLRASSTISSTTTDYTWDTSTGSPRLVGSGSTDYVYGVGSAPVLQLTGSASDLLLSDSLGSVHGLVQLSSGSLQDKLVNYTDYDAYGNASNTGGLTQTHTGINSNWSVTSTIGFAGAYEDPTGLVYMQHRYYDPGTGQFMSLDPLNKMTNAGCTFDKDNPFANSDPTGTIACGAGPYCSSSGADSPHDQASANSLQPPTTSASTALPPLPSSPPPPGYDCTGNSEDCNQTGPRYSVSSRQDKQFLAWATYSATKYCEEDLTDYPVEQLCTPQNILSNGGYFGCAVGSAGGACQFGWVGVGQEPVPQNLIGGGQVPWFGTTAIGTATGCGDGAAIGTAVGTVAVPGLGAVPGFVAGCIVGGVVEPALDWAVFHGLKYFFGGS